MSDTILTPKFKDRRRYRFPRSQEGGKIIWIGEKISLYSGQTVPFRWDNTPLEFTLVCREKTERTYELWYRNTTNRRQSSIQIRAKMITQLDLDMFPATQLSKTHAVLDPEIVPASQILNMLVRFGRLTFYLCHLPETEK